MTLFLRKYVSDAVTADQVGVAPLYFPLSLVLNCPGMVELVDGVEEHVGDSKVFEFSNVPVGPIYIEIKVDSEYSYPERLVNSARDSDGRVALSVPLPQSRVGR